MASSKYIINGEIKSEQGSSEDSMLLAEKIANHKWHTKPDIAYILDIAETKDGAKAIELNCYSTSGFYLCKTDHIKMVNDAIIIELQESYWLTHMVCFWYNKSADDYKIAQSVETIKMKETGVKEMVEF